MDQSEFLSRRALIGAGSIGATGIVAAAVLQSAPAQAQTTPPPPPLWKNVLNYGVALNSASNQAASIQNALDDLTTNDCLVFPPGIYNVGTGVLLLSAKHNIHISAYGAVFQVTDNGTTHHDVLRVSNANNITISGLKISSYLATAGSGIVVTSSTRTVLRDINIWNMGVYCLDAYQSWWLSTYNCQFMAAGVASVNQNSEMNAVTHVGSRFAPYAYATTAGNPVNAGAVGVRHHHGSAVAFIGCDFSLCDIGAEIRFANAVTFQGCYFEEVGTGIRLGYNTYPVNNTTVESCYLSFPAHEMTGIIGIDVVRAQSVLIRNNYFVTTQKPNTTTLRYNNSNGANKNVVIDANTYIDSGAGAEKEFMCGVVHTATSGTPDKVKTYSLVTATVISPGNC